jgi:hypothetical protein
MTADITKSPPTPPRVSVVIGGEERELYMSFGLLNEVTSLVGGIEAVPNIHFDPRVSAMVLDTLLAKRDRRGRILWPTDEEDPITPIDLSVETATVILDWAAGHALDFFVRQFGSSATMFANRAGPLAEVGSSLISSVNSHGKTASS